jgi:hypothetical protein
MPLSDSELVDRIRAAAAQAVAPDRVEDSVGERAWINTTRPADRLAVQGAEIEAEDSAAPVPRLRAARDVVYWGRPLPGRNPRIVGIAWHADGSSEVFLGVLYPP